MLPVQQWSPFSKTSVREWYLVLLLLMHKISTSGLDPSQDLQWSQAGPPLNDGSNGLLSVLSPQSPAASGSAADNLCLQGSCLRRAMYGHPGTQIKLYCEEHKQEIHDMISEQLNESGNRGSGRRKRVSSSPPQGNDGGEKGPRRWFHKKCRMEGCSKQPCFALAGSPPLYCNVHRTKEMQNVASRKCQVLNCTKQASYGQSGGQILFCLQHKNESHVNLRTESSSRRRARHSSCGRMCLEAALNETERELVMKKDVDEMSAEELRLVVTKLRSICGGPGAANGMARPMHCPEPWYQNISSTSMQLARLLEMDYDAVTFDKVLHDQFDVLDRLRGY